MESMKKIIVMLAVVLAIQVNGQMSAGFVLDARVKELSPNRIIDGYFNLGLTVKKNLSTSLNLVSGASIRFFDSDVNTIASNTDMITHFRDVHPTEYFSPKGDYFRFTYINVPIGLEFKATTFMRLQYNLENNFLIGTSDEVDMYMQYGKESMARHMFTHNVNVSLHEKAIGVGLGFTFHPAFIRRDLDYTYQFMSDFQESFKNAYSINLVLWGDFRFKQRKKAL